MSRLRLSMLRTWLYVSCVCLSLRWRPLDARLPLPTDSYRTPGDVSIGSLIYLHDRDSFTRCNQRVTNVYGLQMHMAEIYAIEKINANSSLLGRIQLGYRAKEECFIGFMSVGQSLDYLGVESASSRSVGEESTTDRSVGVEIASNGSVGVESASSNSVRGSLWVESISNRSVDDQVVGITGPLGTTSSMAVAGLLTLYQTAQVSQTATNDILSDRGIYPYFYRSVPPDSLQTRVMMDTLSTLNWTYVSVVHEDDNFGYNAIKYIRRLSHDKAMCIADSYPVDDGADLAYFTRLTSTLVRKARYGSHGVILFLSPGRAKLMLEAAAHRRDRTTKLFFFLSADSSWMSTFEGSYEDSVGALTITWSQQRLEEVEEYLRGVSPSAYPANIFLKQAWDDLAGCSLVRDEAEKAACYTQPLGQLDHYFPVSDAVQSVLGIYAFAHAMDELVRAECPQALQQPSLAPSCIRPHLVSEYLKRVQVPLGSSLLSFNENGEMIGDYRVKQLQYREGGYSLVEVGVWPQSLQDIQLQTAGLQWYPDQPGDTAMPSSLCAKPCGAGEAYLQGELTCCWQCRRCRNNEYVTDNQTSCQVCPYLTWPDQDTFTTCLPITESYLTWWDMYGISLLALAGCGLVVAATLLAEVIRNRGRRVIKGAVLDMQLTILSGVLLAFASVPLYVLPASDVICLMTRVTFSASCTLIFGPIFVKTQLVYHVFAATERFKRSAKMANVYVKVSITATIFFLQVAILAVSMVMWPVSAIYRMPVRSERYVELQCDQEVEGLLLPLSYNIFLISLCSVFAFLTRKLPDNFNESWYIFISVSTTLFVWTAFLPTYFSAFYAYHKAALLALALLLNAALTIICMFAPKIYALHYVADRDIKVSDFRATSFSQDSTQNKTCVSVVS